MRPGQRLRSRTRIAAGCGLSAVMLRLAHVVMLRLLMALLMRLLVIVRLLVALLIVLLLRVRLAAFHCR